MISAPKSSSSSGVPAKISESGIVDIVSCVLSRLSAVSEISSGVAKSLLWPTQTDTSLESGQDMLLSFVDSCGHGAQRHGVHVSHVSDQAIAVDLTASPVM